MQMGKTILNYILTNIEPICRSIAKNDAFFADYKQEVCFEIMKVEKTKLNELYNQDELGRYMYGIAKNVFYMENSNFNRKIKGKIECVNIEDVTISQENDNPTVISEIIDKAVGLDKLIIREYYKRNCSISQLAEATGTSRIAIKKRLDFALQNLRECLKK